MLSAAEIWASQAGQRDRGRTIESPRGTRWATTVTKLPILSPPTKAKTAAGATAQPPIGVVVSTSSRVAHFGWS